MKFCEKLRKIREERGLTQPQLAKLVGLSYRTIQQYEGNGFLPRYSAIQKISNALEIPLTELMGDDELFVAKAAEEHGSRGARQASDLVKEVSGLFSGGKMAEEDMDEMMRAISEAYWIAKENNRKYARKKRELEKSK